ncbi:hypothetical protein ACFVXG_12010 [Kitasatospora sp. NPDC058162]|uniref:hypothetical protein n=1 Tax=Kitasatospora sp. NPDC058162 TaxID=3346362 RepID=UPI0036DB338E
MSRTRTDRSPARRLLAVCALTGAALMTVVTGGQAWADGSPQPAPAKPTAAAPDNAAAGAAAGGARPTAAPAKPGQPGQPSAAPAGGAPGVATPSTGHAPVGSQPQVREVPKGAAQAGDGSGATDGNGLMLVGGGTVAAVGAGALGFALLRRRSGARG